MIGENPIGKPNNLMPLIAQVAVGRFPHVNVMGADYDTPDGTGNLMNMQIEIDRVIFSLFFNKVYEIIFMLLILLLDILLQ